jgi:2-succinyl-5-enolpyruvyl-6-hydroxy-3-cyclohexene-1-carboxylate synthase
MDKLHVFLQSVHTPLIVVSTLPRTARETVVSFLLAINAPVYLEGISGLREDPRLQKLRLANIQNIWRYPIDGILRIGGVPTPRFWRDLESMSGMIQVLSVSHLPWKGLSWGDIIHDRSYSCLLDIPFVNREAWLREEGDYYHQLDLLLKQYSKSEPGVIRHLSQLIPSESLIYIGNSLPIREWDLAATNEFRNWDVYGSRGMNGIDGQLSTFLGMCQPGRSNWCILGDLTALYDLAAPWILDQLKGVDVNIVIVNNGGGMIFSGMSQRETLLNRHQLSFEHFAKLWSLSYQKINNLSQSCLDNRLIEFQPCPIETADFWKAYPSLTTAAV